MKTETRGRKTVITPFIERVVKFMAENGKTGREIANLTKLSGPTIHKVKAQLGLVRPHKHHRMARAA